MPKYYVLRDDGKALLKNTEGKIRWTSFEERAELFHTPDVAYLFCGRFRELQGCRVIASTSPRMRGIIPDADAA